MQQVLQVRAHKQTLVTQREHSALSPQRWDHYKRGLLWPLTCGQACQLLEWPMAAHPFFIAAALLYLAPASPPVLTFALYTPHLIVLQCAAAIPMSYRVTPMKSLLTRIKTTQVRASQLISAAVKAFWTISSTRLETLFLAQFYLPSTTLVFGNGDVRFIPKQVPLPGPFSIFRKLFPKPSL